MKVREFVDDTDQTLVACTPGDPLEDIARRLTENTIGALPVLDATGRLVGIISERDLVRAYAKGPAEVARLNVRDVMTANVITISPEDDFEDARALMTEHAIRHLPIVDEERVIAVVSIRDLVASQRAQFAGVRERLAQRLEAAESVIREATDAARRKK